MAATVKVSLALIGEMLFGATDHPVEVIAVLSDETTDGYAFFLIDGKDVPSDAGHGDVVEVIVTEQRNRAGDRLRRMTFRKA
jgi:hypothetical protein